MKKNVSTDSYTVLLNKVRRTLIEGQRRIEQQRVRTYWETGDHIFVHILKYKDRGDYGEQVLVQLADDLDTDVSILRRCLQFREKYPRLPIHATWREFTWSHYREFITIADDKKRLSMEKAAAGNDWTVSELAARIKQDRADLSANDERRKTNDKPLKPLTPLRGTLYTYQIGRRPSVNADATPQLRVDLGFGVFHKVDSRLLAGFSEGDIVESRPKEDSYKFYKTDRTAKDLYTYAAEIERVIDGDTLKVRFDLGFNMEIRQTLRLRGIDCPEMDTSEGLRAKSFVQSYIKEAQTVIVRSSRSDKYDRYLADVFIPPGGIYLNNLLLEHGHAVRINP